MAKIQFGEIEGIKEGDTFISRQEMTNKGLHRNTVQGIDGNGQEGSASIVLNGGYEDDEDRGNLIIYTGMEVTLITNKSKINPGMILVIKDS